jgi:hypothetical protein
VLWHCAALASAEYCSLRTTPDGHALNGTVVLSLATTPCQITYAVQVGRGWSPLVAQAVLTTPRAVRHLELRSNGDGTWSVDGALRPDLAGCSDLDLGWTPSTNTVPIRRLNLTVGTSATIRAAWLRVPELDVIANAQRYDRLAIDLWRAAVFSGGESSAPSPSAQATSEC